jgi:cellulose synthase/poly-beta-1,6-N-acetylglucosamine synthase-like glycosyltransferase
MLERGAVIEHGTSRPGRWLRERRLRIALWVAVIEGIFIVFHQIPVAVAIVVGIAVVVLYFTQGDRLTSDTAGQVAWIGAVSQVLVMLVPIFLIVFASIALLVVAILAVAALVLLFSRRR